MKKLTRFLRLHLLLILFMPGILPTGVHRAMQCRSDPVVILSNGMTLDISAAISTLPMQVTEVHYELHVPVGVSLVLSIATPTWLTSQETFTLVADQPPKQYRVITTAHTSVGNADVQAETLLLSPLKLKLGRYVASGKEGEALSVSFSG